MKGQLFLTLVLLISLGCGIKTQKQYVDPEKALKLKRKIPTLKMDLSPGQVSKSLRSLY